MARGINGLSHRQERFCRAYVEWGCASTAARAARYAPRWAANHGYRLLKQPRIRARIAGIQAEIAHDACRHGDVLLGKLEMVYRRALQDRSFYAAARAVDLQAKLAMQFARTAGAGATGLIAGPMAEPVASQPFEIPHDLAKMTSFDEQ